MDYNFLNDRFIYDKTNDVYISKKTWRGSGTGDDSKLYIDVAGNSTLIWWRQNRGYESTIFDGKIITSEEDFEKIFDLLDIKTFLNWEDMEQKEKDTNVKPKSTWYTDYKDYIKAWCAWERRNTPEVNIKPKSTTVPYITSERDKQIERMAKLGINTTGQMFEQMVSGLIIEAETRQLTDSFKYKK